MSATVISKAEQKKSAAQLFCECSSIRGMPKIARSSSEFLRKLWLAFVIAMTLVLGISTSLSIRSYLQYDVIEHTSNKPHFISQFPAITVCLHQPFSSMAYSLWSKRSVMSPREYNRLLRDWARRTLKSVKNFEEISPDTEMPISFALYYDMVEMYYQNVRYEDIKRLSHQPSVIRKCIVKTLNGISHFEDPCNLTDYGFKIKLFSHPRHLNCYTVEPQTEAALLQTNFVGLAVDLGPKPDYNNHQQGFLNDVFDQATGLRVVIHEPQRYPDVENFGKNIEAGKMTELAYTPTLRNRSNTPVRPCIQEGESYVDLGRRFQYTQRECTHSRTQAKALEKCGCIIAVPGYPRPLIPSSQIPYCGSFTSAFNKTFDDFLQYLNCFSNNFVHQEHESCLSRCVFYEYETKLSVTHWGATDWQVYWSGKYLYEIEKLSQLRAKREKLRWPTKTQHGKMQVEFNSLRDRLLQYLDKENLSDVSQEGDQMVESKNFAYVVLKRKDNELILKEEKQVLTLNALMSQIGGLCSLTIGLTCAFVVEVLEFFYIYCKSFNRSQQQHDQQHEQQNEQQQQQSQQQSQENYWTNNSEANQDLMPHRKSPSGSRDRYVALQCQVSRQEGVAAD